MARNRAIDRLRARRTRGQVDTPEAPETAREPAPTSAAASPEDAAGGAERIGHIRSAMARLPTEQRELIAAAFFEGYTHSELAARFGLPLGTVKTRIRNGMLAMRDQLEHLV
jgi:RNA polymerase sigma-70 factor (ECF subfamily)